MHDQLADQAELYVLGALSPLERLAFETHLAVCADCVAHVRSLAPVVEALAVLAPAAEPAPAVRERLISAVGADRARPTRSSLGQATASRNARSMPGLSMLGPYVLAASLALAVALGAYAAQLRGRVSVLETRLREATLRAEAGDQRVAELRRTAFEAQSTVAVLAAPDLVRIDLAGQPAAPSASARALWSRSRGLVFTASNLPVPPPGRAYQLWVLTAQTAPMSAGMLTRDANGRVSAMIATPPDMPQPIAMAVTLEPEGGVPSPTGDKYLVGLAN